MHRIGIGQDSHPFLNPPAGGKKPLTLGGIEISQNGGLEGNSDSDVILHSLCNALSSAIGGDSLATWTDKMCAEGITDSKKYVDHVFQKVKSMGYKAVNVSIAVEAKRPRLPLETIHQIKNEIAKLLQINPDRVGITFTSGEELTSFGLGKGIQSISQVLISGND